MKLTLFNNRKQCFFDLTAGLRKQFSAMTPKAMLLFARDYDLPIITDPQDLSSFDTVYFSLHCFRDFYRVADISHLKRPGQEWVAGGNAAATPIGIAWIMDYVYIGDCRASFGRLVDGDRQMPGLLDTSKGLHAVQYVDEDLREGRLSDVEIEMSKGCPRRCVFCIHPWRHRYQEQPKDAIVQFVQSAPGKGVGLVSNSSNDVSYYEEIAALLDRIGKTDMTVSNSVQGLTDDVVATRKREIFLGVEGMSERLRRVVNKPIKQEVLRDKVAMCLSHGKQVRTVYQFNLPGETMTDFMELQEDVAHLRSRFTQGSWSIPFIPNQPSAHTPFQWVRPRYSWDMFDAIQAFRTSLFGSRQHGIAMYAPAPLGGAKWFAQLIAEWIPITPRVAAAVKKLPDRASVETMVAALDAEGIVLPAAFLDRRRDTVFPWAHVQTSGDDSDKWARYEQVQRILAGPHFREESAA